MLEYNNIKISAIYWSADNFIYLVYNEYETYFTTYINHGIDVCVPVVFVWE